MIYAKRTKYVKDDVYKSIMRGDSSVEGKNELTENKTVSRTNISTNQPKKNPSMRTEKVGDDLDDLVHKSYYITRRHEKALKIRMAYGDRPEERDYSAIVRAALDLYLADTLKNI